MHDKTMELLTFNKYHSFEKNFLAEKQTEVKYLEIRET